MDDSHADRDGPDRRAPAEADAGVPAGAEVEPGLVGTVLGGRYRIVEKLGEGAMGAVYLGEHLKIGRLDAIKVLRSPLAGDAEAAARFLRGARNVSVIRHPNVCTIYDFSDTAEGLQFLAMEFVPGETLRDVLQREGILPLERAAAIAVQTAAALQAAHDAGIVHRDLKPANIMIAQGRDGTDAVKVVDFDIAKDSREGEGVEVTRLGFVVGTPEYMSPEQLMGERLDGRSDVYSLALVLFRMLTGSLPFRADNAQDVMIQRLTQPPLRLAEAVPGLHFPATLEHVLARALERKPADRQADAAAFGRELEASLPGGRRHAGSGAPELPPTRIAAAPEAAAATAGKRQRRARRLWIPAAALAGIAAALLAGRAVLNDVPGTEPPAATASGLSTADGSEVEPPPAGRTGPAADAAARQQPAPASGAATAASPDAPSPQPAGDGAGVAAADGVAIIDANATLWRQFERVGPPHPPHAALEAIRDTVRAVWELDGATPRDRAFAAYVLGNVLIPLGDTAQGRRWAARAVELCADCPGYRELLDYYGSLFR